MSTCSNEPRKQLYNVVVWYRDPKDPSKDERVFGPETVEAVSVEHAQTVAVRKVDAKWDNNLQNLKADVRPF